MRGEKIKDLPLWSAVSDTGFHQCDDRMSGSAADEAKVRRE